MANFTNSEIPFNKISTQPLEEKDNKEITPNNDNNNNNNYFKSNTSNSIQKTRNEKVINNDLGIITESFIENHQATNILKLIIENSATIQKGEIITITPNGLTGSLRKNKTNENEVFFGYQSDLTDLKVDFLLPPNPILEEKINEEENNSNERNEGIFFRITYHPSTQKYTIKDLEKGNGTFIKLTSDYLLVENSLINIGDSYLVFTYIEDENESKDKNLLLKAYSGSTKYEPIIFQKKIKKEYFIGRGEKDDVLLQDKMLSRVHCMIYYNENGWFIKDGNENGKPSTNGTWVFAFDEMEIIDGMLFKANSNLFSCHIHSNVDKYEF